MIPAAESIARARAAIKFEGDAPRAIDVDRVAGWRKTFQDVKIKPGKVHLLRCGCGIQAIEANQDAPVHPASLFAVRPFDHKSASALVRNDLITM